MSERPKEHASKACEVQASVGSNPTATANTPQLTSVSGGHGIDMAQWAARGGNNGLLIKPDGSLAVLFYRP